MYNIATKANFVYMVFIALALLSFFLYQTCSLGLKNVASNEDIRHRWNGHRRNQKAAALYKKESGCCSRFNYLIFGDPEQLHGPSKLENYAELVETFYEIQRMQVKLDSEAKKKGYKDQLSLSN